jgi:hypothetical protein
VYILIDMALRDVELVEPDDTRRFHVAVAHGADLDAVTAVLADKGVGTVEVDGDDERAWISVDAVRELAEPAAPPGWGLHFDQMLKDAAKHGWVSEDGSSIRSHIEWLGVDGV